MDRYTSNGEWGLVETFAENSVNKIVDVAQNLSVEFPAVIFTLHLHHKVILQFVHYFYRMVFCKYLHNDVS